MCEAGDLCQLDCKLVDNSHIQPLLGRKAFLGMKIVSYLENDELHKLNVGDSYTFTGDKPCIKGPAYQEVSQGLPQGSM